MNLMEEILYLNQGMNFLTKNQETLLVANDIGKVCLLLDPKSLADKKGSKSKK